jgi:hypothetical protein
MTVSSDDLADGRPQGVRIEWDDVAAPVRHAVERELGSTVVAAANQRGGFSPGTAARLALANGDIVFAKAVSSDLNDVAVRMHRREAAVLSRLPAAMPVPCLRCVVDADVHDATWVVVVTEFVDGRLPRRPWVPAELDRVLALLTTIAELGTPNPVPELRPLSRHTFGGLAALDTDAGLALLDAWSRDHLAELVDLEATWPEATAGDSLQHVDSRADNVLLGPTDAWLVDWPHASVGAPWVDLMSLLPSAVLDGAPDPEAIWSGHPLGRAAPPEAADAWLAALTGYFLSSSLLPPPPGLPTLRAFQLAQGEVSLAWLGRRVRAR